MAQDCNQNPLLLPCKPADAALLAGAAGAQPRARGHAVLGGVSRARAASTREGLARGAPSGLRGGGRVAFRVSVSLPATNCECALGRASQAPSETLLNGAHWSNWGGSKYDRAQAEFVRQSPCPTPATCRTQTFLLLLSNRVCSFLRALFSSGSHSTQVLAHQQVSDGDIGAPSRSFYTEQDCYCRDPAEVPKISPVEIPL